MEFCSWCGDVVEGSVVRFGLTVLHPCCHEEMNDERDVCERYNPDDEIDHLDPLADYIDDEDSDPRFQDHWQDEGDGRYDDDPNAYDGTYSEE